MYRSGKKGSGCWTMRIRTRRTGKSPNRLQESSLTGISRLQTLSRPKSTSWSRKWNPGICHRDRFSLRSMPRVLPSTRHCRMCCSDLQVGGLPGARSQGPHIPGLDPPRRRQRLAGLRAFHGRGNLRCGQLHRGSRGHRVANGSSGRAGLAAPHQGKRGRVLAEPRRGHPCPRARVHRWTPTGTIKAVTTSATRLSLTDLRHGPVLGQRRAAGLGS